jgi:hypothetical protein
MFIGVSRGGQRRLVQWKPVYERSQMFRMSLAAAVATGMVVLAVAALDAVGADKGNASAKPNELTQLVTCLRDRGVDVPNLSDDALERWFPRNVPDADGRACKQAIAATMAPDERRAAKADGVEKIVACLRAKGFDPPTDPMALKQWIGAHPDRAADCGIGAAPDCGAKKDEGQ